MEKLFDQCLHFDKNQQHSHVLFSKCVLSTKYFTFKSGFLLEHFFFTGFPGYGYFQAAAAHATTTTAGATLITHERANGSSYATYDFNGTPAQPTRTDANMMGRDTITFASRAAAASSAADIMAPHLTSPLTPGTTTPALVAQALSGKSWVNSCTINRILVILNPNWIVFFGTRDSK